MGYLPTESTTSFCLKEGKTPYEALYNKRPSIGHPHPFYTKCFVTIPEAQRVSGSPGSELEPRALEGHLTGFIGKRLVGIYLPNRIERTTERTTTEQNTTIERIKSTRIGTVRHKAVLHLFTPLKFTHFIHSFLMRPIPSRGLMPRERCLGKGASGAMESKRKNSAKGERSRSRNEQTVTTFIRELTFLPALHTSGTLQNQTCEAFYMYPSRYRIIPRIRNVSYPISIAMAFKIYTMRYVYGVQNSGTLTFLIHGYFLNMGTFLLADLYGISFTLFLHPLRQLACT